MKIDFRDSKGITIIALIITIIIMIILATISIKYGFKSINSTQDSVIESGLETVQQALIQQHTKANTIEKNDKDADFSNTSDKYYIGTPQDKDEIKRLLENYGVKSDSNKFNLLNFDYTKDDYNSTKNDDIYYKLESSDLEKLGIDDAKGREYLVNYSTGEVWDLTNIKYNNGNYAYINGIGTELEISKEDFTDSPIKISLENDVQPNGETYVVTLKVTDDFAKISQEPEKKQDNITIEDFEEGRIVIKIDNEEKEFKDIDGKIDISTNKVNDPEKSIGEYYKYSIIIDKSIFPNEESSITFIIKEETLRDEKDYTNTETELTASLNELAKTQGTISFSLGEPKYFTKSDKYPDGYTDDQNRTWGTSAIVELTLECNTGLLNQDYVFLYAWDKYVSDLHNKNSNVKIITLRPREGDKVVKGSIYLDSYTGEGTLTVGPNNSKYMGIHSNEIGYGVKTIPVNLDNQIPVGEAYVGDELNNLKKLDEYSDTYFRFNKGFKDKVLAEASGSSIIWINPNIIIKFFDNESGFVLNDSDMIGYYYSLSTEPQKNLIYGEDDLWFSGYAGSAYKNELSNDLEVKINTSNELTSGEFYINMGLRTKETDIIMCDEVGNTDSNVIVKGPIKIDFFYPSVNNIILDNENAKITISDDYSGLSKDYSKIKYAWVKSKDEIPTEWNTITEENIKPIQYNDNGNLLKLQANIELPDLMGEWYLCTSIEGYKDIAGNEAYDEILYSDESFGFADDLKIDITENDPETGILPQLSRTSTTYIKIYSESNKKLKLNRVWYEYKGLGEEIPLLESEIIITEPYIIPITSTVNGPIIVHVIDCFGNEYTEEYSITRVQATILTYQVNAGDKFILPILVQKSTYETYYGGKGLLFHIDWGDNENNFVNTPTLYANDTEKIDSVLEKNAWIHTYSKSSTIQIEFTGTMNQDYVNWHYDPLIKRDNISYYNLLCESRERLIEINQFGLHFEKQVYSHNGFNNWFENCINLKKLPEANEVNKNAFKSIESLYETFANTGISYFDKDLLDYAENISNLYGMFRDCKNLEYVDSDIFEGCKNAGNFGYTFKGSGIKEIPEDIFKNQLNAINFSYTFSDTNIIAIPPKLFQMQKDAHIFSGTFSRTNITYIPQNLFENQKDSKYDINMGATFLNTSIENIPDNLFNNLKVDSFAQCFSKCNNITKISSKMFGNNMHKDVVKNISWMFSECQSLEIISDNVFNDFVNMESAYMVFESCGSLKRIDNFIFSNCKNMKDISGMFYNCTLLEEVNENLFDDSKTSIEKLAYKIPIIDNPEIDCFLVGIFENCTKLKNCPPLWNFREFTSLKADETTYDSFVGVQNQSIRDNIINNNLKDCWLENHYIYK